MEKNNEPKSKVAQTYAEDMVKVLEDDKNGLVKKIIHEEEEHEIEKQNLSPESNKNRFFIFIGTLLIALGFFALFYFVFTREIPTVSVEQQFTPLIFNDKSIFIEVADLKKEEIMQTVANAVEKTEVKDGGVEGIYLAYNKQVVGLRKFIGLMKANFVPGNNAQFVSDHFMMGVVKTPGESDAVSIDSNRDFFILLKVRSITDIFNAMRSWEAKMFSDLYGFFGLDLSSETSYLLTKNFEDGIVENKNARILYTNDKEIVMMYIFAADNSVIITSTGDAAHEIILRLEASRIKK